MPLAVRGWSPIGRPERSRAASASDHGAAGRATVRSSAYSRRWLTIDKYLLPIAMRLWNGAP
jgi:hypothetical protein